MDVVRKQTYENIFRKKPNKNKRTMHTQSKVKRLRLMSRNEPERTVRKGSIFAEAKRIVKKWGKKIYLNAMTLD